MRLPYVLGVNGNRQWNFYFMKINEDRVFVETSRGQRRPLLRQYAHMQLRDVSPQTRFFGTISYKSTQMWNMIEL